MFASLFDMESIDNKILITAGGKQVEDQVKDETLSRSLLSLWAELGIQDIESIE
ncbi:MAG TPA: hypothetical protein VIB07_07235 [Nitrososphaera sp.]|jgi:hypothetical protein